MSVLLKVNMLVSKVITGSFFFLNIFWMATVLMETDVLVCRFYTEYSW